MFGKSFGYLAIEILCLCVIGIFLDITASYLGINTDTWQWFLTKLTLFLIALYTFLPDVILFLYEKLTGKRF